MEVRKYIGIPYVTGGNDFNGADCYTICCLISKNELNIELPDYSNLYADASITKEAQLGFAAWNTSLSSSWTEVTEPEVGDIIIFNFYGAPTHCGFYIGDNKCLHASEGRGSYIAELYGSSWEHRIEGIMRYAAYC